MVPNGVHRSYRWIQISYRFPSNIDLTLLYTVKLLILDTGGIFNNSMPSHPSTFVERDGNQELPDAQLRNLTAASRLGRARASGAGKALEKSGWDVEDSPVLVFNGSSTRLLDYSLAPFAAITGGCMMSFRGIQLYL